MSCKLTKFISECSRKQKQAEKFIGRTLHPNEYFRCTENGDYDVIQCIDDKCMCTDPLDGIPTYPTTASINMEDISNKTLDCCKILQNNSNSL